MNQQHKLRKKESNLDLYTQTHHSESIYQNYRPTTNLSFNLLQLQTIIDCKSTTAFHPFQGVASSGKSSIIIDFIKQSQLNEFLTMVVNKSLSALQDLLQICLEQWKFDQLIIDHMDHQYNDKNIYQMLQNDQFFNSKMNKQQIKLIKAYEEFDNASVDYQKKKMLDFTNKTFQNILCKYKLVFVHTDEFQNYLWSNFIPQAVKMKLKYDYTLLDDSNLTPEIESQQTFLFSKKLIINGDLINTRYHNFENFHTEDKEILQKVKNKFHIKQSALEQLYSQNQSSLLSRIAYMNSMNFQYHFTCNKLIIEFINKNYQNNTLIAESSVCNLVMHDLLPSNLKVVNDAYLNKALWIVDTNLKMQNEIQFELTRKHPRENLFETFSAKVILEHLTYLGIEMNQVGVMAHYIDQLNMLHKSLNKQVDSGLLIGGFREFIGVKKEVILYCFVDNATLPSFDIKYQLSNAMLRARKLFCMIGNTEIMYKSSYLSNLVDEVKTEGQQLYSVQMDKSVSIMNNLDGRRFSNIMSNQVYVWEDEGVQGFRIETEEERMSLLNLALDPLMKIFDKYKDEIKPEALPVIRNSLQFYIENSTVGKSQENSSLYLSEVDLSVMSLIEDLQVQSDYFCQYKNDGLTRTLNIKAYLQDDPDNIIRISWKDMVKVFVETQGTSLTYYMTETLNHALNMDFQQAFNETGKKKITSLVNISRTRSNLFSNITLNPQMSHNNKMIWKDDQKQLNYSNSLNLRSRPQTAALRSTTELIYNKELISSKNTHKKSNQLSQELFNKKSNILSQNLFKICNFKKCENNINENDLQCPYCFIQYCNDHSEQTVHNCQQYQNKQKLQMLKDIQNIENRDEFLNNENEEFLIQDKNIMKFKNSKGKNVRIKNNGIFNSKKDIYRSINRLF